MTTDRQKRPVNQSPHPADGVGAGKAEKSHSGPKKAPRISKKRKTRNALYRNVAEFKRRHPKATAAETWTHFCTVAEIGAHDVLIAHDASSYLLRYRPDPGRFDTRTIKQDSFARRWREIV